MDMGSERWSSPSTSSRDQHAAAPAKCPAGRTKFKETRHPVFRGVRRRSGAGRWVCEVRVPGRRGCRLWLGTYVTAGSAARAHDAAMLALGGRSAACLNFVDSAWLLAVPSALADLADVRRAALAAVAGFHRREAANCAATVPGDEVFDTSSADDAGSWATPKPCVAVDGVFEVPAAAVASDMFDFESGVMGLGSWATSQPSCAAADGVLEVPAAALGGDMFDFELDMSGELVLRSRATSQPSCADGVFEVPAAAMGGDMFDFELDMSGEMDLGSYYADFAEGLLLEPPPPADATEACWQNGDYYGDGRGDAAL